MASVAKTDRLTSDHKRCVNALIHERTDVDSSPRSEQVAFVCECPSAACFQTVWMSASDYETYRLDEDWVVLGARHQ
jgi:hypothetical protein